MDTINPSASLLTRPRTNFRSLMQRRINKVLMICSGYDAYSLEEDGRIEAQITQEYLELNLSYPPSFVRVSTSAEAMELLTSDSEIDLVITMLNVGEPNAFDFALWLKKHRSEVPSVLLTNFSKELYRRLEQEDASGLDYIFSWHGNADLLMAIIKLIEDEMNAEQDILQGGVQAILLVEDSIRYYSTYLPAIYKLILHQNSEFLKEALNEQQQKLRKRARPKILLANNYTDAVALYQKYKHNLLGVISDVGFVLHKNDPAQSEKLDAGIDLCKLIKKDNPQMPFLMQSSQESMRSEAEKLGVGFLLKYSKNLLFELGEYISRECSFGDLIFTNEQGEQIGRVQDLQSLQRLIMEIPEEDLRRYTSRNSISKWMYSRGLFSLAGTFAQVQESHFEQVDELRKYVSDAIREYRILQGYGVVAKFDSATYSRYIWFARIGEGSIGGKARGLAFINKMLQEKGTLNKYPGVKVMLPRTVVIATDYFDAFIRENGLQYVINSEVSDEEILSEFVSSRLPNGLVDELRTYLHHATGPLAVRSSSKLEDAHYQPFAGVYSTYMLPLTQDTEQMLRLLGKAVKSVYASIYFRASRAYIQATSNLLGEEKMAVVIQDLCGTEQEGYFFPTLSGVARSLNFYPIGNEKAEDGVVNLAFGLGKLVVEGGQTLRFSPKYPKNTLQLSTPELTLRESQREMYALDLKPEEFKTSIDDAVNLKRLRIEECTHFRNIRHVSSYYDRLNQRISETPVDRSRNVITFSRILKYGSFPLPEIITDLLTMGEEQMRSPVEIEFAVNMDVPAGEDKIFNFLQIRPIVDTQDNLSLNWEEIDCDSALIYAESALGVGAMEGISDVIYIPQERFDKASTREMGEEIAALNQTLREQDRGCILVGAGRWGSSDPWLGIPIRWSEISQARVIVECGLPDFQVEASQGTHFFQNLTSFGVGYLTINPFRGDGRFDQQCLDRMEAIYEGKFFRHVRFPKPLYVFVDGRKNRAIIHQ